MFAIHKYHTRPINCKPENLEQHVYTAAPCDTHCDYDERGVGDARNPFRLGNQWVWCHIWFAFVQQSTLMEGYGKRKHRSTSEDREGTGQSSHLGALKMTAISRFKNGKGGPSIVARAVRCGNTPLLVAYRSLRWCSPRYLGKGVGSPLLTPRQRNQTPQGDIYWHPLEI